MADHVFTAKISAALNGTTRARAASRSTTGLWVKPVLVGQFEFVEWTPDDHLRHAKFVGLREDKDERGVARV